MVLVVLVKGLVGLEVLVLMVKVGMDRGCGGGGGLYLAKIVIEECTR